MEKAETRLPKAKLGSQGLEVSRIGLGCMGLSGYHNAPLPHEAGCAFLKEAFNRGITFFDTSDTYGQDHHNEIMIGKALKELPRDKIQLATKFGVVHKENGELGARGTPEYARECCENSLKRLDVNYIDLYYLHRVDSSIPIEDTVGELKKMVEEGKINYIGLSEASANTIRRAHAVHPITAVQMEYSLWTRDIEEDIIPVCRELGIGIVAYSPLGLGFLAGKSVVESSPAPDMLIRYYPRFESNNLEKNESLYARIAELAAKHYCTCPQLALAWLLNQEHIVVPIPGTTKIENLVNNIGSLAVKLTKEDLREISDVIPVEEVAGERCSPMIDQCNYKNADTPSRLQ